jgi:hypothetical protein
MSKKHKETDWINYLLWGIYILLLMVLLPHTAWMFARGESSEAGPFGISWGIATAWAAATVFELVIAAMTHKLSSHISKTPKYTDEWKRLRARYVNAYGAGLLLAWVVSTYANLAHAVEFGQTIKIFNDWGLPVWSYSVAFGAILPTASLLFAWVLSSVIEQDSNEAQANPELDKAKETIRILQHSLRQTEELQRQAEQKAAEAELRFNAAGDMFAMLLSNQKKDRVLFARQRWPQLPQSAIAIITEVSPARVSEVLTEANGATRPGGAL